jgi:hypothetical protein
MIYERTDYFAHNNLKTRSRSHRTERDVGSKREGIINVVEVLASPYKLTLILSFVLSDYSSKIRDCKLKMYKNNSLVNSNPKDIASLVIFGKATYNKMIQNFIWATGYNVVAIPLAAGVLYNAKIIISPAMGAVFMSISTIIVAINAQLLKRKMNINN